MNSHGFVVHIINLHEVAIGLARGVAIGSMQASNMCISYTVIMSKVQILAAAAKQGQVHHR
jgi:hypothetical protein